MALVYNPTIFENIPSLEVALQTGSLNKNFPEFLTQFFRVAAEFSLLDSYGVTLVHRHTKIDQGQRLMDFKQTLQPFPLDGTAQELGGCPIRPKSLALVSGTWNPYEYELGDVEPLDDSFLTEVGKLISRFNIPHVGLRRYSPEDPEELEVTERGGISVKMPLKLVSLSFPHLGLIY